MIFIRFIGAIGFDMCVVRCDDDAEIPVVTDFPDRDAAWGISCFYTYVGS
jgi:hypothetical protein